MAYILISICLVSINLISYGSIRANNPILDSFYLNRHSGIVGQLIAIDRQMSVLNDSALRCTPEAWLSAYAIADSMNNELEAEEIFAQNAKYMNSLYLNTLLRGHDTLSEEQEADIETLAFTCPYTGGNAVYRARILHGMRHWGIHYDDLVICNGHGVFKNGTSKLKEQLNQLLDYSYIQNQIQQRRLSEDEAIIYPNPAHHEVSIRCKDAKRIVVYDLQGGCRINKFLNEQIELNSIETSMLSPGIYIYKLIKLNGDLYTGKLSIE